MAELLVCFHKGKLFFKYFTHLQLKIIYNICMIRKICLCRITQNREWCWESQTTRSLTCVSISLCTLRAYSMSYDPGNMDFLSFFIFITRFLSWIIKVAENVSFHLVWYRTVWVIHAERAKLQMKTLYSSSEPLALMTLSETPAF